MRDAVQALLAHPRSAEAAVELALLNNPGLKVQLAELGLAETDLVRVGTLRNPVFAYSAIVSPCPSLDTLDAHSAPAIQSLTRRFP